MFEDKNNLVGIILLMACGISAGVMLGYINTGTLPDWDVPAWLYWGVIIGGLALMFGGFILSRRGPKLGNDVRSPRRWFRRDKSETHFVG